ncbi:MAG: aminotransferase class V-fold PLP-dependent enzyme [Acidobacteriota bacterium]
MSEPLDLHRLRGETPGCGEVVHLNNAGSALAPAPVHAAVREYLDREELLGGYEAAAAEAEGIEEVYDATADLLGCRRDQVALMDNATAAFAAALSAIELQPGDAMLTSRADYVSNQIMFLQLGRRRGVRLLRAEDDAHGVVDPESVERLVRQERPRLVAISHIPTYSGRVQNAEIIGAICQTHGVPYLLDACQSVGQIPVDVEAIGCDFLSATGRKYLRGPRGTGFLYVSDRALDLDLMPLLPDLRGAEWISADRFEARADARRFEYWEFSYALLRGLGAAARYALEVGIEAASQRAARLAATAREHLGALDGVHSLEPEGARLAAITTYRIDGIEDGAHLVQALRKRKLHASVTQADSARIEYDARSLAWALRVSPHYYNTEAEILAFAEGLAECLAELRH